MKHYEFDEKRYEILALPRPLLLHWILNPGIALNEIILGQRIPKLMLIEKSKEKYPRSIVPCPHCGGMHDGLLWSGRNGFGHWLGYICPTCNAIIPCLWNLTSIVILILTFPIWLLILAVWKTKWLEYEKARIEKKLEKGITKRKQTSWLIVGVFGWGTIMWVFVGIVPQLIIAHFKGSAFDWAAVLIQLPIWLGAGLLFGGIMKWYMGRYNL